MTPLTEDEKNELFREQCYALESSCAAYDKGQRWEAKRLATTVFTLCHDPAPGRKGSLSKSLLGQMGLKKKLSFLSTARKTPDGHIPWLPLAMMKADDDEAFHFAPNLDLVKDHWRQVSFFSWWEEPIFRLPDGRKLTRRGLVFAMRSQDGGSHADEAIRDAEYAAMRSYNDPRVTRLKPALGEKSQIKMHTSVAQARANADPDYEPVPYAHLATMRQVAFELSQSVGRLLPTD